MRKIAFLVIILISLSNLSFAEVEVRTLEPSVDIDFEGQWDMAFLNQNFDQIQWIESGKNNLGAFLYGELANGQIFFLRDGQEVAHIDRNNELLNERNTVEEVVFDPVPYCYGDDYIICLDSNNNVIFRNKAGKYFGPWVNNAKSIAGNRKIYGAVTQEGQVLFSGLEEELIPSDWTDVKAISFSNDLLIALTENNKMNILNLNSNYPIEKVETLERLSGVEGLFATDLGVIYKSSPTSIILNGHTLSEKELLDEFFVVGDKTYVDIEGKFLNLIGYTGIIDGEKILIEKLSAENHDVYGNKGIIGSQETFVDERTITVLDVSLPVKLLVVDNKIYLPFEGPVFDQFTDLTYSFDEYIEIQHPNVHLVRQMEVTLFSPFDPNRRRFQDERYIWMPIPVNKEGHTFIESVTFSPQDTEGIFEDTYGNKYVVWDTKKQISETYATHFVMNTVLDKELNLEKWTKYLGNDPQILKYLESDFVNNMEAPSSKKIFDEIYEGNETIEEIIVKAAEWGKTQIELYDEPMLEEYIGIASTVFETKKGFGGGCDTRATTSVTLLRMNGIPARVLSGMNFNYLKLYNRTDMAAYSGHLWLEAYFEEDGWVMIEPWEYENGLRAMVDQTEPYLVTNTVEPFFTRQFWFTAPVRTMSIPKLGGAKQPAHQVGDEHGMEIHSVQVLLKNQAFQK